MPTGHYKRNARVKRVVVTCVVCGKDREYLPSNAKRISRRFCSKKCQGKSARKPNTHSVVGCSQCGIIYKKRTDKIALVNCCSKACLGESKKVDGAKWRSSAQIKRYMRDYQEKNRERLNELAAARDQQNPEQKAARARRWRAKNKDKINAASRARRAASGYISPKEWGKIKELYGNACVCCGLVGAVEMDHVIPVVLGGTNTVDNVQPLCRSCNAKKWITPVDYRIMFINNKLT